MRLEAAELAAIEVGTVDPVEATAVHGELRAVTDQLRVLAARLLSVIDADGRLTGGGARTVPEAVARREGTSVGSARRELALGRALEAQLPSTRTAVASGDITLEHAQVLSTFGPTSEARRAALASDLPDRNEDFLVRLARTTPVDVFRRRVRTWAAQVDRDGAEREHAVAAAKEHLTLYRRDDGVALQGFLTAEHGALLTTALRAVTGVPAADDERTSEQRAAAGLTGLARLVLDGGLAGAGAKVRPHISVHVGWETMQALDSPDPVADPAALAPAELETGEPLPGTVLQRLLCDSEITRIVFGPDSQVLDVGRAQRTYGGQLRRAVVARDRRCAYPGCDAPPALGEVHHVVPWSHGGATSVENGILLCWYHHDLVHKRRVQIRSTSGGWSFAGPDGAPITGPRGGRRRGESPPGDRVPSGSPPGDRVPSGSSPGDRVPSGSSPGDPSRTGSPPGDPSRSGTPSGGPSPGGPRAVDLGPGTHGTSVASTTGVAGARPVFRRDRGDRPDGVIAPTDRRGPSQSRPPASARPATRGRRPGSERGSGQDVLAGL
nr:HNH endonuclease signature motif containing protein [Cellulomonas sp. APG4]